MYTVVIDVPFRRLSNDAVEVAADWARSLILLRDSFNGRFGSLTIAAPEMPPGTGPITEQQPVTVRNREDGIDFVRIGSTLWKTRGFWSHYFQIRGVLNGLIARSDVVHAGINNLYWPYSLTGFHAAARANKTTVFILDGDAILRERQLAEGTCVWTRLKTQAYCRLYYRQAKHAVSVADLSLLKGRALYDRYAASAKNAKQFYNTSYTVKDIIANNCLESKRRQVLSGAPLRCVSIGRLVRYKEVSHTIEAVARAAAGATNLTLDIIGDGPDRHRLSGMTAALKANDIVRFLGAREYGSDLLRQLRDYHLMMFTSLAEETPRALFDGMAAGCALAAYDIPFTREIVSECRHGALVPRRDVTALSDAVRDLHHNRAKLASLMTNAASVSTKHSAEVWYRRRAEWTTDAYDHCQRRRNIGFAGVSPG